MENPSVESQPEDLLADALSRASNNPFFMAYAMDQYKRLHQMSDEILAAFLKCESAGLARLGLCRKFSPSEQMADMWLRQTAAYAGVSPEALQLLVAETS